MILLLILAALFALFFLLRRRPGPAFLAVIAGLSVYSLFGESFAHFLHGGLSAIPENLFQTIIYIALVVLFPMLPYLRSSGGGLFGPLRIICALGLSVFITCLIAPMIAQFITFDELSVNVSNFISQNEGIIVLIGIVSAYLDILIAHF